MPKKSKQECLLTCEWGKRVKGDMKYIAETRKFAALKKGEVIVSCTRLWHDISTIKHWQADEN